MILTVNNRQAMVQNWMRRGFKRVAFRIDKGFLVWGLGVSTMSIRLFVSIVVELEWTGWQAALCAVQ